MVAHLLLLFELESAEEYHLLPSRVLCIHTIQTLIRRVRHARRRWLEGVLMLLLNLLVDPLPPVDVQSLGKSL